MLLTFRATSLLTALSCTLLILPAQASECESGSSSDDDGSSSDDDDSSDDDSSSEACDASPDPCAGAVDGTACDDGNRCNGEFDTCSAGVCLGSDLVIGEADHLYFTTDNGVYRWSSVTGTFSTLSNTGSYAIALAPSGEVYVGEGGSEWAASGRSTSGIYRIDGPTLRTQVSPAVAEDIQFSPAGTLHYANATGIYSLALGGGSTQLSTRPVSQFAFDSAQTVVTTNGSAYSSVFTTSTNRIQLSTPANNAAVQLLPDGGEDIHVQANGDTLLCGQSGLFQLNETTAGNSLTRIIGGFQVFNFGLNDAGDHLYLGNSSEYDTFGWSAGVYEYVQASGQLISLEGPTQPAYDINALVVDTVTCK